MPERSFTIAVIGAGLSGVTAATVLARAGHDVTVFEKSRGLGGRMSTRVSRGGLEFDHGAQYFTARSREFQRELQPYLSNATVSTWSAQSPSRRQDEDWWVAAPRMKSLVEAMGAHLKVQLCATAKEIEQDKHQWRIRGDGIPEDSKFDFVIVSAPAPQAKALTQFSQCMQSALSAIEMAPCWALMIGLSEIAPIRGDVITDDKGSIRWLARNKSKPGRTASGDIWVGHASASWSRENLELDKEEAAAVLWQEARDLLNAPDSHPMYLAAHRWRYARVTKPLGSPFIPDETGSLFAIGDGCLGPRVECAFESGLRVAEHILGSTETRNEDVD